MGAAGALVAVTEEAAGALVLATEGVDDTAVTKEPLASVVWG